MACCEPEPSRPLLRRCHAGTPCRQAPQNRKTQPVRYPYLHCQFFSCHLRRSFYAPSSLLVPSTVMPSHPAPHVCCLAAATINPHPCLMPRQRQATTKPFLAVPRPGHPQASPRPAPLPHICPSYSLCVPAVSPFASRAAAPSRRGGPTHPVPPSRAPSVRSYLCQCLPPRLRALRPPQPPSPCTHMPFCLSDAPPPACTEQF